MAINNRITENKINEVKNMKISHVSEMRDLDRQAIKEYGITQEILMENAGQAAYFTILK